MDKLRKITEVYYKHMKKEPNNQSTATNPVGRFMVAVGAIIELESTGTILIVQRASDQDWRPNEWEIDYGRIDQFEDPEDGLRREIFEEVGIKDLKIEKIIRIWHIYRGSKKAENDLVGITYFCRTQEKNVHLSNEHLAYQWVTPEKALQLIETEGVRTDVGLAMKMMEMPISTSEMK